MPLSALESTQSIPSPCVRPLTVHQQGCFILRQVLCGGQERTDVRWLFGIAFFREKGLTTVEDQQYTRFLATDAPLVGSPFATWTGEQEILCSSRTNDVAAALRQPSSS